MTEGKKGKTRIGLKLYVAGQSPRSLRALANLHSFCCEHLADGHVLNVIDVLETPEHALADRVRLTPQLVVTGGESVQVLVGDLGDPQLLHDALSTAATPNE